MGRLKFRKTFGRVLAARDAMKSLWRSRRARVCKILLDIYSRIGIRTRIRKVRRYGSRSLCNDGPGWRSWRVEVGAIVGEIPCPGNERQRDEVCIMQRFMHRLPFSADSAQPTSPPPSAAASAYLGGASAN